MTNAAASTTLLTALQTPDSPFPGLRPFQESESYLFFGRDEQVEKLLVKLSTGRFHAVVGTSGSGKSSLVRAGLLPSVRGEMLPVPHGAPHKWRIADLRPSNDPIGNLARALNPAADDGQSSANQTAITEATLRLGSRGLLEAARQHAGHADSNLLVLVDQFEELFRFAHEARKTGDHRFINDAALFVKLLLECIKPGERAANIYVLLTMRSDFLGDCAQFQDLPEAINESQYLIPRLTRDQLREVIEGPVAVGGGRIAPRLVNQLLNDIADNQDQLPILQHALMRTWEAWRAPQHEHQVARDEIDLCCYDQIGGMARALSDHADTAFGELDTRHQQVAEKMFKALTEKGDDNREIRRPVTLGDLCAVAAASEAELTTVIETFRQPGRSFLMPPFPTPLHTDSLIDISHESLIRVWQRLQAWVNEEAESAAVYRRLADAARRDAERWRGRDLQEAEDWQTKHAPTSAWANRYDANFATAMTFLRDSQNQRAEERERAERQQREEAERAQRELAMAQSLAEAEKQRADDQAKAAARLRRFIAALVLIALLAGAAAVLAGVLYRRANEETRRANQLKDRAQIAENEAIKQRAYAITGEEDAKKAAEEAKHAAAEAEKQKAFADAQTLAAELARKQADKQRGLAVNEQQRAEAGETLNRQLYYAASMNLATNAFDSGPRSRGYELMNQFLPATKTAPASDLRDFYWRYLWKENHQELATLRGHEAEISSVAFAPNGNSLASADAGGIMKLWDVRSGQLLNTIKGQSNIESVAFSPDGRTLASGGWSTAIKLWDIQSGRLLVTLSDNKNTVHSLAFTPDGKVLASGRRDGIIELWDVKSSQLITTLKGHQSIVWSVMFSSDGNMIATTSGSASNAKNNTIKLWDMHSGRLLKTLEGHLAPIHSATFAPDNKTLASASSDGTIKFWDLFSGRLLNTINSHKSPINSIVFALDGKTLVSASSDGIIKLWDPYSSKLLSSFKGHEESATSVTLSSNGTTIASGSKDKTVKLWHLTYSQPVDTLKNAKASVTSVAFAPDGKTFVSASGDFMNNEVSTIAVWDTSSGQQLTTFEGNGDLINTIKFSPDGKLLIAGNHSGTIKLWDGRTYQFLKTIDGHRGSVNCITFAFNNRVLVSGSNAPQDNKESKDDTIKLWDIYSGRLLNAIKEYKTPTLSVTTSPDGKMLAAGGRDGTIKIWDIHSGQPLNTLGIYKEGITSVTFSPDGKALASGEYSGPVRLWDARSGQLLKTFEFRGNNVNSVVFTSDGKTLASADRDAIMLWDTLSGQLIATLKGHKLYVSSIAFDQGSKTLVSAEAIESPTFSLYGNKSKEFAIRLWRGATDEEVARQRNQ